MCMHVLYMFPKYPHNMLAWPLGQEVIVTHNKGLGPGSATRPSRKGRIDLILSLPGTMSPRPSRCQGPRLYDVLGFFLIFFSVG